MKLVASKGFSVSKDIARKHAKRLVDVAEFEKDMLGVTIQIKTIRWGQLRPYADSVYEALILAYRPRVYTTGAPAPEWLTKEQVKWLARNFIRPFSEQKRPPMGEARLVLLKKEESPGDLDEKGLGVTEKSSCWRVVIQQDYMD